MNNDEVEQSSYFSPDSRDQYNFTFFKERDGPTPDAVEENKEKEGN